MLKNRPILMVLTGIVLAFLLWIAVFAFQESNIKNDESVETPASATNAIPEEYAVTPASVQKVNESPEKFIVSGIGVAGAGVSISVGESVVANSKVDGDGDWVLSINRNILSEKSKLEILMATPDGRQVRSDQELFIINGLDDIALVILTAPGENSRVLQTPFEKLPSIEGYEMEAIDYDNSGGVIFSGKAAAPAKVRIYANENLVGESRVDRNGRWTLIFGSIMPLGEYNISAEFVPDDGAEPKKLTLPFSRIEPLFAAEGSPKIYVENDDERIQVGRALYGGGYQYTAVYSPGAIVE
ncbi:MAG: hypothetical protein EX271_08480 [Acidimicrobiales bacterium]|nr:hypothetical protein [Hyphomonadaceae bacterium]RZV41227.1 MAG: hypothetical protein EX271_08480 [Acidimicrobiales bacterium]